MTRRGLLCGHDLIGRFRVGLRRPPPRPAHCDPLILQCLMVPRVQQYTAQMHDASAAAAAVVVVVVVEGHNAALILLPLLLLLLLPLPETC